MGIISAYLSNNPGNGDNINKIPKNVTNGENNSHNNVNKHNYLCCFKCYWGQRKVTDTTEGYFTFFCMEKLTNICGKDRGPNSATVWVWTTPGTAPRFILFSDCLM